MSVVAFVRWLHVLAAAAWLGEVVTVVFVIVPIALRLEGPERSRYLSTAFPRVFRLASVLAIVTLAAGAWLNFLLTGWRDLAVYLSTPRGLAILAGGLLGLLLGLFHFVVEGRLEPRLRRLGETGDDTRAGKVLRFLRIAPRAGLIVLVATFLLMMIGSRGI